MVPVGLNTLQMCFHTSGAHPCLPSGAGVCLAVSGSRWRAMTYAPSYPGVLSSECPASVQRVFQRVFQQVFQQVRGVVMGAHPLGAGSPGKAHQL